VRLDAPAYKEQGCNENGPYEEKIGQNDPGTPVLKYTQEWPVDSQETKEENEQVKFSLS
jgi:hypothetical protein